MTDALQPPIEAAAAGLSGNLFEMPLIDVLQMLVNDGGGARVALLPDDGVGGEIYVRRGLAVFARHGDQLGDAALGSLLGVERGTFAVTFRIDAPGRNISEQAARPLLEDLRDLNAARSHLLPDRVRSTDAPAADSPPLLLTDAVARELEDVAIEVDAVEFEETRALELLCER